MKREALILMTCLALVAGLAVAQDGPVKPELTATVDGQEMTLTDIKVLGERYITYGRWLQQQANMLEAMQDSPLLDDAAKATAKARFVEGVTASRGELKNPSGAVVASAARVNPKAVVDDRKAAEAEAEAAAEAAAAEAERLEVERLEAEAQATAAAEAAAAEASRIIADTQPAEPAGV